MLSELRLRNFKRFGDEPTRIPLAPLTLILGANSTGKSSILQALLALKQSWETRIDGFLELRTEGPWTSLGRFGNVQHGHDSNVDVEIGLTWATGAIDLRWSASSMGPDEIAGRGSLAQVELRGRAAECSRLLTVDDRLDDGRVTLAFNSDSWRGGYADEPNESIALRTLLNAAPTAGAWTLVLAPEEHKVEYRFKSVGFNSDRNWTNEEREAQLAAYERHASGLNSADKDPTSRFGRMIASEVEDSIFAARRKVDTIRHVGPIRIPGQRVYSLDEGGSDRVGAGGERLAEVLFRIGGRLGEVNELIERMGIPYDLAVRELPTLGAAVELLLPDQTNGGTRGKPPVGISDVGFGVSQVLPILAEWAGMRADPKRSDILLVEQPEAHLHPAWQVKLLRLLAEPLRRDLRQDGAVDQVILETHSEVMVLAAQQLVRRGLVPREDICILSVERSERDGRSSVSRIDLDEHGRFRRRWPNGFFLERDDLLLDTGEGP